MIKYDYPIQKVVYETNKQLTVRKWGFIEEEYTITLMEDDRTGFTEVLFLDDSLYNSYTLISFDSSNDDELIEVEFYLSDLQKRYSFNVASALYCLAKYRNRVDYIKGK